MRLIDERGTGTLLDLAFSPKRDELKKLFL